MPVTLSDVREAISATGQRWEAGETDVSRYATRPLQDDAGLFGLSISDDEADRLLAEASTLQALTFQALAPPPTDVDWRNYQGPLPNYQGNYVTDIKHQRNCGACVAFATCAALEARVAIQRNKKNPQLDLSEAHLFFCGCGMCCKKGWNFVPALNWAKNGIGVETDFGYTGVDVPCKKPAPRPVVDVPSWTAVTSLVARKQAIAFDGPVIGGLNVYEDFYYYKNGVYRQTVGVFRGRHAVCIVGYNDGARAGDGYWIIKNSWGVGWGDKGYMNLAYNDQKCGLDSTFAFYDAQVQAASNLVV